MHRKKKLLQDGKPHDAYDADRGAGRAPPDNGRPTGRKPANQPSVEDVRAAIRTKTHTNEMAVETG